MTERVAVFERPGADFTLRRTLELLWDSTRAARLMATESRFVILAHVRQGEVAYVRASNPEELFTQLGRIWLALSRRGVRDFSVDTSVEPETKRIIDETIDAAQKAVRPPAANDP